MQIYSTEGSLLFNTIPQHNDAPVPHWRILHKARSANGCYRHRSIYTAMESLHPSQDGINAPMCSAITLITTIFQWNKRVAFNLSFNIHDLRNFAYWNPSYVDIDAIRPFVIKWWRHTSTLLPHVFSALTYLASHSHPYKRYHCPCLTVTSEQTSNPAFLLLHFQFSISIRIIIIVFRILFTS
jgi:hypothetical protein